MRVLLLAVAILTGCSTNAEMERPEDIVMIRGSYTTVSVVLRWLTGGTDICQLTGMEDNPELLAKYSVILDEDGCTIIPTEIVSCDP